MPCCKRDNLVVAVRFLSLVQGLCSLVLVILGSLLAANAELELGFGSGPSTTGKVVVVVALADLASCNCGRYGSRAHNKFCLLVYMLVQLLSMALILLTCSSTIAAALDDYPDAFQEACSTQGRNESCTAFLGDEKRVMLRSLWKQMFAWGEETGSGGQRYIALMEDIQTAGRCCGFDAPYGCTFGPPSLATVADHLATDDAAPATCGAERFWYSTTDECDYLVQFANGTSYAPGCPFSLPAGQCIHFGYEKGCVFQTRQWLLDNSLPLLEAMKVLAWASALAAFASFALFMKRKDNDVLPTTYVVSHRPSKT